MIIKLEKKINLFVFFTVLVPMFILLGITTVLLKAHIEKNEQNYLSVSMNYARQLLFARRDSIQCAGSVLVSSDEFQKKLLRQDYAGIENMLQRFDGSFSYLDYVGMVDAHSGRFISSNPESKYESASALGKLVQQTLNFKVVTFAEEVLPLEDIFLPGGNSYKKLLVKLQNPGETGDQYMRKGLAGINLIPIFNSDNLEEVLGVLILADILNNDTEFTNSFSEQMKEAFLAVSIDGVRILSSITTEDVSDYVGSRVPIKSEVLKVEGTQHFGKQYFKATDEYHVFVDEEIHNLAGKNVAMIGLGIPEKRFYKILSSGYVYIFAAMVICLVTRLF